MKKVILGILLFIVSICMYKMGSALVGVPVGLILLTMLYVAMQFSGVAFTVGGIIDMKYNR